MDDEYEDPNEIDIFWNDIKFVELLYKQLKNYNAWDTEITYQEDNSMTYDQVTIMQAIMSVQSIGENGNLESGLERIEKNFSRNFELRKGGGLIGKGNPGRKPEDSTSSYDNYVKITALINRGISQKQACDKIGMPPSTYRRYKKNN